MTDDVVTANTHWFLQYIQEHISDEAKREALEAKTLEAIANNQTHFLGSVKVLIGKSVSKDPYEAIREWEFYNEEIAPSWVKRDKKNIIGSCNLCGSDISRRIVAFRNTKNGEFMSTGTECKTHLNETFEFFDYTIRATEKRKKEKTDNKQKSLQDLANDPVKAINEAINNPKTDADKELANMLKQLYDRLRPHFDLLESIQYASPDAFSEKDFTPYFITPEKNGNFIGWFGQQGKNKLPDFIWDIYSRSKKDLTTISQSEWAALYMYSSLHREESKKVFIGSIEDDLRLLESLDPEHEIIKKYGGVNLDSIRDILDSDDVKITLLDVRKVFDAKPNILEIRKDINKGQASLYGKNVLEVLYTLEQIFLNEQGLWKEEFKTDKAIYSKTLNRDDYLLVKNLLKRAKLGKGTREENIYASYSIKEFREEVVDSLEVIRRKLDYQADILRDKQEQGLLIDDAYDVTPELLAGLKDDEFLRGNSYRLAEKFSSEEDVDELPEEMSLNKIIDRIDRSEVSTKHKLFHRMKNQHFDRMKKLEEHGLYHKDDVKRLLRMYKTVENYEECFAGDEGREKKGLVSNILTDTGFNFLILEAKALPDMVMDYVEPDAVALVQKAANVILRIPVLIQEAEDMIRARNMDKRQGQHEKSILEMLEKLEDLKENYTLYTTSLFTERNFYFYVGNVGLESCIDSISGVKFYNPKRIEEKYSGIREGYLTYARALVRLPQFMDNLKDILDNNELIKKYIPGWFSNDETTKHLYDKISSGEKEKVLVSRVLVDKVSSAFAMLSMIKRVETGVDEEEIKKCITEKTRGEYDHDLGDSTAYNIRMEGNTFEHKKFIQYQLNMVFNKTSKWHMANPVTQNILRFYALEITAYNQANNSNLIMSISRTTS